jgi:diguanylate cyclase (GGDEF)-like protein/PAS domain S-box-containing protein
LAAGDSEYHFSSIQCISSAMLRRQLASLQVRLSALMVLLVLASLWVFALALSDRIERELLDTQSAHHFATVGYVAEDIDNKIRLRLDSLASLAAGLTPELLADGRALQGHLAERRALFALFDLGIIVVRPRLDGAFGDYPAIPGRRSADYGIAPFRDVARSGRPAVGPPRLGRFSNEPVVVFAVPVKDAQGRLIAILSGATSVGAPSFLDLVQRLKLGRTGSFLVVAPAHGIFVTGTDPAYRLKPLPAPGANVMHDRWMAGGEGSGVARSSTGVEELSSARHIPAAGWFVVARMPTAEAFAPVERQRVLILGGAAAISVLAALLAGLLVRSSLQPLAAAAGALDAASRGERAPTPLPVVRADEVGRLAESFNRLLASLQQKEAELVAARAELKDITDSVPVAVFRYRIDEQGRSQVMYVSDRIEALWGVSAADMMRDAETGFARIHPDDRAAFLAADHADWRAHAPSSREVRIVRPDGAVRWMLIQSTPKRLADGTVVNHGFVQDITERKQADEDMVRLQQRFAVAFRASPIAASIARARDGRFVEVNARWEHDFGWSRGELIGRSSVDLGVWPDAAARERWVDGLRRTRGVHDEQTQWRRKDGALRDVSISAEMIELEGEACVLAFVTDITERLRSERALAESEARNRRMIETANEGIWAIDPEMRVTFLNRRMADMLGYAPEEILGRIAGDFLFPEDRADQQLKLEERRTGRPGAYERRFRRKDGSVLWTQVSATALTNPDGSYGGAFAMFTDISHFKDYQFELERMAHFDPLTGIPNRVLLADRMQLAIARTRRAGGLMAVCYLDLDGFKPINDAYGHEAGDRLLVEVSRRLRGCLRGGDTVARLGGDEFVVLLLDLARFDEVETALRRILDAIAQEVPIDGTTVTISASVGVALFPSDDDDPDTLLRHADQAMYAAKQQGKNRWQMFDALRR